jgi:hypothetical protein
VKQRSGKDGADAKPKGRSGAVGETEPMQSLLLDGDKKSLQTVTWNMSQNKVDTKNVKLRKRHLELVIARIMKARAA